ncbi:hypothetical protein GCM10010222_48910 [Streptomyces tanashiensis]|nr:hypothetical protein GCM10010222_48910 [Streptomyces tanashiensis]
MASAASAAEAADAPRHEKAAATARIEEMRRVEVTPSQRARLPWDTGRPRSHRPNGGPATGLRGEESEETIFKGF